MFSGLWLRLQETIRKENFSTKKLCNQDNSNKLAILKMSVLNILTILISRPIILLKQPSPSSKQTVFFII